MGTVQNYKPYIPISSSEGAVKTMRDLLVLIKHHLSINNNMHSCPCFRIDTKKWKDVLWCIQSPQTGKHLCKNGVQYVNPCTLYRKGSQ